MEHTERQNKSSLKNTYKCIQTEAHTQTPTRSHPPSSIQRCAVKSLTPAVVVSWFKGSVITKRDELACECQQHRVELGGEMGWPLEGETWSPSTPRSSSDSMYGTASPEPRCPSGGCYRNLPPEEVSFGWKASFHCFWNIYIFLEKVVVSELSRGPCMFVIYP